VVTEQLLTHKQAVRELKQHKKVVFNRSLLSLQPMRDKSWRLDQQIAQGGATRTTETWSGWLGAAEIWHCIAHFEQHAWSMYAGMWHTWSKAAMQNQLSS